VQPLGDQGYVDTSVGAHRPRQFPRMVRRVIRSASSLSLADVASRPKTWKMGALGAAFLCSIILLTNDEARSDVLTSLGMDGHFRAEHIVVSGNRSLADQDVAALLKVHLPDTLVGFDVSRARQALLDNSWIKSASLRKVYPDTVMVNVEEHEPAALWKINGSVKAVASDGHVIHEALLEHADLPQMVGIGANTAGRALLAGMQPYGDLRSRASAYVRVADRRWNLVLRDGPTIMLPEKGWREALVRLQELDRVHSLLDRAITAIDLRLFDRTTLRLNETVSKERRERINETLKRKWHVKT